ncbi:hypothetical protein [Parvicella tangerina]|uniref:Type II CBASS E2 protein domain-containing protein n=1 Tax=Parvicella tangerina TaxID=2829795 RepID=A0A916N9P3_9FLAO|nr:hypothetical protein [Parvicella tangerina]CAG5077571.1 hypothetical protein CRYO30217_00429 [Parvicella tangerina]
MAKRASLIIQEGTLKSYFPGCKIIRYGEDEIVWEHNITPSPLSGSYTLKLHYIRNKGAKVYVLSPKPLPLAPGKTRLPHVYSTPEQRLCLYYPVDNEWDVSMLYVQTLIPWACEWLIHYELWVATGNWLGGGIEHENIAEKKLKEKQSGNDEILGEAKKKPKHDRR